MYALMYLILYIASIHCYIPLSTVTSMSVCSVCIVLWHDHVNGEIKAQKKLVYIHTICPENLIDIDLIVAQHNGPKWWFGNKGRI